MTLHRGCEINPAKCHKIKAYIRLDRKHWSVIGYFCTLCKQYTPGLEEDVGFNSVLPRKAKMNAMEVGYVAGMIDGEGYIRVGPDPHSHRVAISNTHLGMLQNIQPLTGGRIYSGGKRVENHNQVYQLVIARHEDIANLLLQVKDHLIIKKDKTLKLLELLNKYQQAKEK